MFFAYLNCPLCQKPINHPSLQQSLVPHMQRQQEVSAKTLQRLDIEGCKNDPPLQAGGRYEGQLQKYALDRFAYYECSACLSAFYGGRRACEGLQADQEQNANPAQGDNVNRDAAKDLICPPCVMKKTGVSGCPTHGAEYFEFKCRFCCGVATFFCFGTTHFCDPCHKRQENGDFVTRIPIDKLPKCPGASCPLKVPHPAAAGTEFSIGCALCRDV